MGSNDASSLYRQWQDVPENRPRSSCMIDEKNLASILRSSDLEELGQHISHNECGRSIWKKIAENLGLSAETIDQIENSTTSNPGYEVLKIWKRDNHSTILVLKNVLKQLPRNDLVEMLEKFMLFEVIITVQYRYQGKLWDMSNRFPGVKTFKDYFITFLPRRMFSNAQRYIAVLDASLKLQWESPVREFQIRKKTRH